jgi:hypothetical protein
VIEAKKARKSNSYLKFPSRTISSVLVDRKVPEGETPSLPGAGASCPGVSSREEEAFFGVDVGAFIAQLSL